MSTPSNFHMSLAYVILNKLELNPNFYECPANWSVSDGERVRRPFLAIYFLSSGGFYTILYLLCVLSMVTSDLVRTPAYKIMISLACFDIPSVLVNSIATGVMGFFGTVFCDFPRLIFFLGSNGFGLWLGCSICCISLAVCRISEINTDLNINWIFQGVWMKLLIVCFFVAPAYGVFLTKPVIFRPEYMSWFFDPGLGLNAEYYVNLNQPINNAILTVITLSLYAYLTLFIVRKGSGLNSEHFSRTQRMFIIQAAILCFFHSMTSTLYVYMQFFYSPEWLIVVAQIGWQICTGSPGLIYLVFNRTLRFSVVKMICPKKFHFDNRVSYISDSVQA